MSNSTFIFRVNSNDISLNTSATSIYKSMFQSATNPSHQDLIKVYVGTVVNAILDFSYCPKLNTFDFSNNTNITSIPNNCFKSSHKLEEFYMPDSIISIGDNAYSQELITAGTNQTNSYKLTSVNLSNTLESIGLKAFYKNVNLPSITIPASVTSIGNQAFALNSSLNDVTFEDGNKINTINTNSFPNRSNNQNSVIHFNIPGRIDSITNANLQTIATNNYANQTFSTVFYGGLYPTGIGKDISGALASSHYTNDISTNQLTKVEIGTYVTEISNNAFFGAGNLTEVFISDNVTTIGNYAFYQCTNLASVTIPDSTISIGEGAFSICSNLATLDLGSGVKTIGDYAFINCYKLSTVTIPNNTISIGEYAFNSCSNLETLDLGSGVVTIGNYAFRICDNLVSVTIPVNTISIGNYAFQNCSALATLDLGSGVETIGDYAFINCYTLSTVTIPNSTTSIGDNAFYQCTNLTTLDLGSEVKTIGFQAFYQCKNLVSVIIPNSTISIGGNAFMNCSALTTLDLGTGVQTIDNNAFQNCSALATVTIPDSTISIGISTFMNCYALATLNLGIGVETIGDNAFQNCSALATVIISDVSGITTISSSSFTDLSGTDSYSGSTITFTEYDSFIDLDNVWIDNNLQSTWDDITSYFETQIPPKQIDPTLSNFSIPTLNITNTEPYTIIPPYSDSSGTFTYDSSNTNIVEISGNTIISENKTAGKTTITATQEETRYYFTGSISAPVTNICFLAGTPVTTDQGNIPIEKINPKIHTIRNKKIVGITQTITQDKHLICFEKNSLGKNIPSQQTIITRNHRIFYKGKMIKACKFTDIKNVYEIKYNGEFLYNVLMEEHDKMIVNNFICETLDPKNDIAKLYRCFENKTKTQIEQMIQCYNKNVIKKNLFSKR